MNNMDLPPESEWDDASTELCGISWPSQQPWTNMSNCCASEVRVSNGCWQYCEPSASVDFLTCALESVNATEGGSRCNGVERNAAARGMGLEGAVVGWLGLLWVVVKLMR